MHSGQLVVVLVVLLIRKLSAVEVQTDFRVTIGLVGLHEKLVSREEAYFAEPA